MTPSVTAGGDFDLSMSRRGVSFCKKPWGPVAVSPLNLAPCWPPSRPCPPPAPRVLETYQPASPMKVPGFVSPRRPQPAAPGIRGAALRRGPPGRPNPAPPAPRLGIPHEPVGGPPPRQTGRTYRQCFRGPWVRLRYTPARGPQAATPPTRKEPGPHLAPADLQAVFPPGF